MEYPFITLGDGTQISHSEMLADRSVLVYIRRGVLCRAVYALPAQEWREVAGFTEDELEHIKRACCRKQFLRHAPFANKSREERRHSIKKQPAKVKKGIRS